jgi:hypothetical protein
MNLALTLDLAGYSFGIWHNLGDLQVSGTVNGKQVRSSPQTVPVWLYIGDLGTVYLPMNVRQP